MHTKWGVLQFFWALISKAVLIAVLIIDVVSYALLGDKIPRPVYPIVLAVGLLIAGYQVYTGLNKQLDTANARIEASQGGPPRIVLNPVSVQFGGHGWQNRMPTPPMRFLANLDLRNLSDQRASLREVRVLQMSVPSELLSDQAKRITLYPTGSARRGTSASLPMVLDPHQWNPNLLCEIQVDLLLKDPQSLAERLPHLAAFSLQLEYSYELLSGLPAAERLTISGDFAHFRDAVLQHWEETNEVQLLKAAKSTAL